VIQSVVSTASAEASSVQSAAQSAVTSISNLEDILPLNCSIGVKEYCLGYVQKIACYALPLNISRLIPDEAPTSILDQISQLHTLDTALEFVSPLYLQLPLAIGTFLLILMVAIFSLDILRCIHLPFRRTFFLILGTVCFSPLLLAVAVLLAIRFKLKSTSVVTVLPQREAEGLYLVAFCFTIGVLVLIGCLVTSKAGRRVMEYKAPGTSTIDFEQR